MPAPKIVAHHEIAFDTEKSAPGRFAEGTIRVRTGKRCVLCGNTPSWVYYIVMDHHQRGDIVAGFCLKCLTSLSAAGGHK